MAVNTMHRVQAAQGCTETGCSKGGMAAMEGAATVAWVFTLRAQEIQDYLGKCSLFSLCNRTYAN